MSRGFSDLLTFESLAHATSGSIGSSIAMTLFYPLDQLRLVLQADESKGRDKKSELAVARDIFEREGVVGFYKGLPPLLVALGVSNFVYFYCFNALKTAVALRSKDGKISTGKNLLVASIAGAINVLLTCPLWVASTRLKLQANPNAAHGHSASKATPPPSPTTTTTTSSSAPAKRPYAGLVDAVMRIGREEGVAALWNGTAASLVLVSNPTIQFTAYEQGKQKLQAMRGANVALTSPEIFVLASYSKAVATLLTYPLQVIQTRMRSNNKPLSIVLLSLVEGGVWSWWRGLQTKMLQVVLMSAFQFTVYEKIVKSVLNALLSLKKKK